MIKMKFPKKLYVKTYKCYSGELEFIRLIRPDDPYYAIYLNKLLHMPVRVFWETKTSPEQFLTDNSEQCFLLEEDCLNHIKKEFEAFIRLINGNLKQIREKK